MNKNYIICVDDEKIILDSLRVQLNRHFGNNFMYEFAESGDEALEILEELDVHNNSIITVISDWQMPKMRGDELLTKVDEKYKGARMLMLTGQAKEKILDDFVKKVKDVKILYKPWLENQLIDEINSSIQKRVNK